MKFSDGKAGYLHEAVDPDLKTGKKIFKLSEFFNISHPIYGQFLGGWYTQTAKCSLPPANDLLSNYVPTPHIPYPALARSSVSCRGMRAEIVVPAPGYVLISKTPCTI
jgi:hypothetical protein